MPNKPVMRKKAEPSVKKMLKGIQAEIGAGMVLVPKDEGDRAHNRACDRAKRIIDNYIGGHGLFQEGVEP